MPILQLFVTVYLLSFSLYMILLILIVNIPCIFDIIYMHYHSLTELVWWFCFIVFSKLFCYWDRNMKFRRSLLTIWSVCFSNFRTISKPTPHVRSGFCSLSFVRGGLWRLDIYCSILCTVTGHCTAIGIFAEIYKHCFNYIFSVSSSQFMVKWCMLCSTDVFYQIIKMDMYYRIFWSVCCWITFANKS